MPFAKASQQHQQMIIWNLTHLAWSSTLVVCRSLSFGVGHHTSKSDFFTILFIKSFLFAQMWVWAIIPINICVSTDFLFKDFDLINFSSLQYFINNIEIHAHCTYCPFRKYKMLGYLAYIGLNGIVKSSSNAHFLFLLLHMALCLELLVTPTLKGPDIWIVEKVHSIFYNGINCWPFISEIWKCHWVPDATTSKFETVE